ncbi:MAG: transposase [Burkholderiales bacterium]
MSAQRWLEFAGLAHQLAQGILPAYAHKCSPRRFRLPQLAACVLLKEYRQLDWRGIEALLTLSPPLRRTLRLKRAPDYSTLWRFARRWLGAKRLGLWLAELMRRLALPPVNVAVDSTGLDPGRTSSYFIARQRQRHRRKRYLKLSLSVVVGPLVAASAVADWGPRNDKTELPQLLAETHARLRVRDLYADAGYDAEWVHVWCREVAGIRSWIPPVVHRADGTVGGYWRGRMAKGLPPRYGRRWAAESFMSGMKRVVGPWLRARLPQRQLSEALLKVLAYSIHR